MLTGVRASLRHSRAARIALATGLLAVIALCSYRVGRYFWASRERELAEAALDLGQNATARAHLLNCLQERPDDPELHMLLARVARREGNFQDADDHLLNAKRLGGVSERIHLEQLLQHVQRGQGGAAERRLWAYVDKDHPDRQDILEALARGYLATFRLDQALAALDRLLELQPNHAAAWQLRGKAAYHMHSFAEAERNYEQAVALAPDDATARLLYADCLFENAKPAAALEHFAQLRTQTPSDPAVLAGQVRCLLDLGQLDEARAALDELAKAAPDDPATAALRGKLHMKKLEPATAERWLRKAVERDPGDREAVYNLSLCLQQQDAKEKKDEAAKWRARLKFIAAQQARMSKVSLLIRNRPDDPAPRAEAGTIFLSLGNEKDGLRWLYSALQKDPQHAESHRALRDYFRGTGQTDRAALHERALQKK